MVPQLSPRMRMRVWFAACDVAKQHKVTVTSRDLMGARKRERRNSEKKN